MSYIARPQQTFVDHHGNEVVVAAQPYRNHAVGVANRMRVIGKRIGLPNLFWLTGAIHDGKHYTDWQTYVTSGQREKIEHASFAVLFVQHYLLRQYRTSCGGVIDNSDIGAIHLLVDCLGEATSSHHTGLRDMDLSNDGRFYDLHKKDRVRPFVYAKRRREYGNLVNDLTVDAYIDNFVKVYHEHYPSLLRDINTAFVNAIKEMRVVLDQLRARKKHDVLGNRYYYFVLIKVLFSAVVDCDCTDAADWTAKNRGRRTARKLAQSLTTHSMVKLADRFDRWLSYKKTKFATSPSPINSLRDEFADKVMNALTNPDSRAAAIRCYGPTGIGKTIAVARAAIHHAKQFKKKKILFLSPFTAILEQNAAIIREALDMEYDGNIDGYVESSKKSRNVLEHHSNVFIADPTYDSHSRYDRVVYSILAESHRSPVVFASFVRVFDMILSNKVSANRRLYNDLVNSVIVLDECQDIPTQYRVFFMRVLSTLINDFGCTVVFCSATIPALFDVGATSLHVNKFINVFPDNDEYEFETRLNAIRRVDEDRSLMSDGNKPFVTVKKLSIHVTKTVMGVGSNSCLVICGTKKSTRSVYRRCKHESMGRYRVFHLSTYMVSKHRMAVMGEIKQCLYRGEPIVVVATSLIEAGVDVDFPHVYKTANASLSSVVQASGRANRNGRYDLGVLHLFRLSSDDENASMNSKAIGWSNEVYDKFPKLDYCAIDYFFKLQHDAYNSPTNAHLVDVPVFTTDGIRLSDKKTAGEHVSKSDGVGLAKYMEHHTTSLFSLFYTTKDSSPDWYGDKMATSGAQRVCEDDLMSGVTLGIPFAGIGSCECIPHNLTDVFVPYDDRGIVLYEKIQSGSINVDEWREMQHYMVGLYDLDYKNLTSTGTVVKEIDIESYHNIQKRDIKSNDSTKIRVLVDMTKYSIDEGIEVSAMCEEFNII